MDATQQLLVGTWASADAFASDVEYIVSAVGDELTVRAIDKTDREEADIFEVHWDGEILTFAAYWNSSGRFARCRFLAQSQDIVNFTYTYTDQDTLLRKPN
jgi:hypothetical protein